MYQQLYERVINFNANITESYMYTQFSKFFANRSFLNRKPDILAAKFRRNNDQSQQIAEITQKLIEEFEKKKDEEVEEARLKITEELKLEHQATIDQQANNIKALSTQVDNLKAQNKDLDNEVGSVKSDLGTSEKQLQKLEEDFNELITVNQKLLEENKNKDEQIETLEEYKQKHAVMEIKK